jgi:hypothetical protein
MVAIERALQLIEGPAAPRIDRRRATRVIQWSKPTQD